MAQKMTEVECIDQMFDQVLTHDFEDRKSKRDLLAGMLYQINVEGNVLQIESPIQIFRNREVCESIGPIDTELSEIH